MSVTQAIYNRADKISLKYWSATSIGHLQLSSQLRTQFVKFLSHYHPMVSHPIHFYSIVIASHPSNSYSFAPDHGNQWINRFHSCIECKKQTKLYVCPKFVNKSKNGYTHSPLNSFSNLLVQSNWHELKSANHKNIISMWS